ncbi:hypothetical protein HNP55_001248 [Paucibacter oligotrophus]|uniref:Putative auto-transporter adhesin head GIN domain-containing protein n=1 Tax=Roseateles oligotrophus TaxID=1769250 RepID=A0A840L7H9_9BURK|nr:head GIN domain-containing protein [Roseateles oligotrophus]MBB4842733.1 hypothetical protein [Roseateles oligotrophus]
MSPSKLQGSTGHIATARLGLLGLALSACLGNSLAQGRGDVEGQLYSPGPFDRLQVEGLTQVKLSQGDKDQVFIVGDPELQKTVQLRLVNQQLRIEPSGGWKFWNNARLQLEISMRELKQLTLAGASDVHAPGPLRLQGLTVRISGAGQVRLDDLMAERLDFNVSGAGDGQLRGQVGQLNLGISGKGKLLADHLRTGRAQVNISGIGNAQLWVVEDLAVHISGVGSVEYWGQPQVTRQTSGLATIKSLGEKR